VQAPLVEAPPLADDEEVELVRVVCDQDDAGPNVDAVDRERLDPSAGARQQPQRTNRGEGVAATAMVLAPVDESRVEAERYVVEEEPPVDASDVDSAFDAGEGRQRPERVVPIETEVAGKVVPGSVRDADEGKPALERDLGDRCKRAVAPRDSEAVRISGACDFGGVLTGAEGMRVDPARPRACRKLVRARFRVPCTRIDDEEAGRLAQAATRPSERSSACFGCAPMAWAAGSPPLKRMMVGMEAMP
jgi:hypothetical protein